MCSLRRCPVKENLLDNVKFCRADYERASRRGEMAKAAMVAKAHNGKAKGCQSDTVTPAVRKVSNTGSNSQKTFKSAGSESSENSDREKINKEAFEKWVKEKDQRLAKKKEALKVQLEIRENQRKEKEAEDKKLRIANRKVWLEKKKEAQEAEEERKKIEAKKIQEQEKNNKKLSKEVVSVWMQVAENRPKAASRSIFSAQLKNVGYLNPQPWRGVLDEDGVEKSMPKKKLKIRPRNPLFFY